MDKAFKSIMKGLEKPIKEYAQELDGGKHEMTEKDPERMFYLLGASLMGKMLCMLEEMKQEGEKKGGNTMGGMMDMMGKIGSMMPQMHHIGFTDAGVHLPPVGDGYGSPSSRRGVPGSGRRSYRSEYGEDNYDHHEDWGAEEEPEDRHRSRRTGRFVRNEHDGGDMNMHMEDDIENRHGSRQGRTGQSGGGSESNRR